MSSYSMWTCTLPPYWNLNEQWISISIPITFESQWTHCNRLIVNIDQVSYTSVWNKYLHACVQQMMPTSILARVKRGILHVSRTKSQFRPTWIKDVWQFRPTLNLNWKYQAESGWNIRSQTELLNVYLVRLLKRSKFDHEEILWKFFSSATYTKKQNVLVDPSTISRTESRGTSI